MEQQTEGIEFEILVVDSGSTDNTLKIAKSHNCRIIRIKKNEFTFGRSLNIGCANARGKYLVFISGHCIPHDQSWLKNLVEPLQSGNVVYTYGRQVGGKGSKFSERQHFKKFYPEISKIPQEGFFVNNANASIVRSCWLKYKFNEELTGLEDMFLAKQLVESELGVGYVADAAVYHFHDENWTQIKKRYEREALALQQIMPEVHITLWDFCRYYISTVYFDLKDSFKLDEFYYNISEIVMFRLMQFWGSYRGNHLSRKLSKKHKEQYYYPK